MRLLLAAARSPAARWSFVTVAVALAAWAVWRDRRDVAAALAALDPAAVGIALLASVANVLLGAASWRAVLADLGSPLGPGPASRVYLVGQLGKYIPGSVWQVVGAAEAGSRYGVPRTRTATASVVAILLSCVTGVLVVVLVAPFAAGGLAGRLRWLLLLGPLLLVVLHPRVLNRLLDRALRALGRGGLERGMSLRGPAVAAPFALGSWVAAGVQVYVLVVAVGAEPGWGTLAVCLGGFAVGTLSGFVAVFAPAGIGVREAVLLAVLAGVLSRPDILTVVLLSRVLLSVSDVGLALAALGVRPAAQRAA